MPRFSYELLPTPLSVEKIIDYSLAIRSHPAWDNDLVASPESIMDELNTKRDGVVFCRDSENVAGALSFSTAKMLGWESRKVGYIANLAVRPPYRRRGIGTALVRIAAEHMVREGAESIVTDLTTAEVRRMSEAMGLILKHGESQIWTIRH